MSVPTPGPPLQGVPEEFAAVYQAAYEQALADYDVARRAVEEPDAGLSIVAGDRSDSQSDDARSTWFERVRDTHWFVPFMLALLVLLLIAGAYGLGKVLADQVDASSPTDSPSVLMGTTPQSPGSVSPDRR